MIEISNDKLKIVISEKGAEPQSMQFKDVEYLWQADAAYWGKHAPVLFPVVGELKNGKYRYDGKEFKLPRHGFARDKVFTAEMMGEDDVIFTLQADDATRPVYPFEFVLRIEYKLEGNEVFCTYIVQNTDVKTMYFSIGGHPAFKLPLTDGLQYTDYSLEFSNDKQLTRYVLQDGLISDKTETINLDNRTLQLKPSLFYTDAIVMKHIRSEKIKLFSNKDSHGLEFKFEEFPYFGIWAAKDAPFVCLEPWCGIADNVHHNYELVHKEGINELPAGESWQRTWSVELF